MNIVLISEGHQDWSSSLNPVTGIDYRRLASERFIAKHKLSQVGRKFNLLTPAVWAAIKYPDPVSDGVKPSFVVFDIRSL